MAGGSMFSNPAGAMGQAKSWSVLSADYVSNAAFVALTPAVFSTTATVGPTATGSTLSLQAGVFLNSGASGEIANVVHLGVTYVACDTGVASGDALQRSSSNAASVQKSAATSTGMDGTIGFALEAVSATKTGYVLAFINPVVTRLS